MSNLFSNSKVFWYEMSFFNAFYLLTACYVHIPKKILISAQMYMHVCHTCRYHVLYNIQ